MTRAAVIIPCHEDGALVVEAVRSIREPEPVEVVVVDDGSDGAETRTALDELARSGVRIIRQPQGGPAAARTRGLEATEAPFVLPLDADDLVEPGAVSALADALEEAPQAGFAWGDYMIFGDYEGRYRTPERVLPWTLTYMNPYPVTSMFRRSALLAAGAWQASGRIGYEDWNLWLRLLELGIDGVHVDRTIYRRRLHGAGRVQVNARQRHQVLYAELRRLHPDLFRNRAKLRRLERPPLWKRLVYPLAFASRSVIPFALEARAKRMLLRRGLRVAG